jgi:hypothetical protein
VSSTHSRIGVMGAGPGGSGGGGMSHPRLKIACPSSVQFFPPLLCSSPFASMKVYGGMMSRSWSRWPPLRSPLFSIAGDSVTNGFVSELVAWQIVTFFSFANAVQPRSQSSWPAASQFRPSNPAGPSTPGCSTTKGGTMSPPCRPWPAGVP